MNTCSDKDKAAKRLKRAAQYKRDVASGKQKLYNANNSKRLNNLLREEKVSRAREFLKASNQMHLEGAVTATIRALPKRTRVKDPLIMSCIRKCEREYERKKILAAARSSDTTTVANAGSTVTSNEDTPGEDTLVASTAGRTIEQPDDNAVAAMAKQDVPNQSNGADAPALVTPYKLEEEASEAGNESQSNDGSNALDDEECIHGHDDDSIAKNSIGGPNGVGLASSSSPKPVALVVPKEEGQPCFVLISNNVPPGLHQTPHLYWPALLYSSKDALHYHFPFRNNNDRLLVQVECGKNEHACGINNNSTGEVKVAILLGSDVPPSLTRSVPVFVSREFVSPEGVSWPCHFAFTKKKANKLKNWKGYSDNNKFLEALDMLERYKATKDPTVFSSMKYRC